MEDGKIVMMRTWAVGRNIEENLKFKHGLGIQQFQNFYLHFPFFVTYYNIF